MPNNPLISVIINTFNYCDYVTDAVESALRQTLSREQFEVIVVDDGSTDDTCIRLQPFMAGIIYHRKENGGQATALTAGVSIARGKYVAFLDADDYWSPDKLAAVLEKFASDEEVGVVYHKLSVVSGSTVIDSFPKYFDGIASNGSPMRYADWLTTVGVATSGISFRIDVVKQLMPIPAGFNLCADAYLMSCAPLVTDKFILIDKVLGYYRVHERNGYSGLSPEGRFLESKTEELALHYHRLIIEKRGELIKRIGCESGLLQLMLQSRLIKIELYDLKRRRGVLPALREFWHSRKVLGQLPGKYRYFRLADILISLFSSEHLYCRLRNVYSRSWLWRLVNNR